jgi:hypothetical protein
MSSDDPQEIPNAGEVPSENAPAGAIILDEPAAVPPPRLGIIHMLAWLTVAAVLFGIESWEKNAENASGNPQGLNPAIAQSFSFASLSFMSAGVVGVTTLLRWRYRNRPQRLAPGHWILIAFAFSCVIGYCISTALRMYLLASGQQVTMKVNLLLLPGWVLLYLAQFVIYVRAAARSKSERGWRRVLILLAIARAVELGIFVLMLVMLMNLMYQLPSFILSFQFITRAIPAIATIVLWGFAVYDAFRVRRDWLHGLGVGLEVCQGLLMIGAWIMSAFLR